MTIQNVCIHRARARNFFRFAISVVFAGCVSGSLRADVTPVAFSDPGVLGFHFPESEVTILGWITGMNAGSDPKSIAANSTKLYTHGWGIWAGLTMESGQTDAGQPVRVFETWVTPEDLVDASSGPTNLLLLRKPRPRAKFQRLEQFVHAAKARPMLALALKPQASSVVGFVKYDPTASDHIGQQGLLRKTNLLQLGADGAKGVPAFPATAFALKPAFVIATQTKLVGGRYYQLSVWPGPPTTPQSFGQKQWKRWVWIDVQGGGSGTDVDLVGASDGSSRTNASTYPISSFINFQISSDQATQIDSDPDGLLGENGKATAGDYAVLVGMHVAGKEITRWTWQTFWWSASPGDPGLPSSKEIASLRPKQLTSAAQHYAMAMAYSNQDPADPETGGTNSANSIYAYNPYLEASFGPVDLPDSMSGMYAGKPTSNNYGVQTNCMSCHGRANLSISSTTPPNYAGARYNDLDDPQFKGTLQLDFLWSLANHAK